MTEDMSSAPGDETKRAAREGVPSGTIFSVEASNPISDIKHLAVKTCFDFKLVLWLNANFRTSFRKRKFGEKPDTFDLLNAKK